MQTWTVNDIKFTIADSEGLLLRPDGNIQRVENREGMVTVYDHEGNYLGCMGREAWEDLISTTARKIVNADTPKARPPVNTYGI